MENRWMNQFDMERFNKVENLDEYISSEAIIALVQSFRAIIMNNFPLDLEQTNILFGESIIAGGSFKNVLEDGLPKDIDLYFQSQSSRDEVLELLKDAGLEQRYDNEHSTCFGTQQAKMTIDVVKRIGDPLSVLRRFDFTVAKIALYRKPDSKAIFGDDDYEVLRNRNFYNDLSTHTLRYEDSYMLRKDYRAAERVLRYYQYGYAMSEDASIRLIGWANDTDVSSERILEEIRKHLGGGGERVENTSDRGDNYVQRMLYEISDGLGDDSKGLGYLKCDAERRLASREISQYALGYDETSYKCDQMLDRYSTKEKEKSVRYPIKPSVTILNFEKSLREDFHLNHEEILSILGTMATPTRFVAPHKKAPITFECCRKLSDDGLHRYHASKTEFLGEIDIHDAWSTVPDHYDRDDEADVILHLLKKFDKDSVIDYLNSIYRYRDIKGVPTEDQWFKFIDEGFFSPDIDFDLFVSIVGDEVEYEHEIENDPF